MHASSSRRRRLFDADTNCRRRVVRRTAERPGLRAAGIAIPGAAGYDPAQAEVAELVDAPDSKSGA